MNEPPPSGPVAPPAPPLTPAAAAPKPKDRRWFVVLAWITLVLFGVFVTGITIVTAAIPAIKRAHEAGR
jgi:hypothetical protein